MAANEFAWTSAAHCLAGGVLIISGKVRHSRDPRLLQSNAGFESRTAAATLWLLAPVDAVKIIAVSVVILWAAD